MLKRITARLAKLNASFDLQESDVMAHWRGELIFFVELHGLYSEGLLSCVDLSEIKITSHNLDRVQEVPEGEQLKHLKTKGYTVKKRKNTFPCKITLFL